MKVSSVVLDLVKALTNNLYVCLIVTPANLFTSVRVLDDSHFP